MLCREKSSTLKLAKRQLSSLLVAAVISSYAEADGKNESYAGITTENHPLALASLQPLAEEESTDAMYVLGTIYNAGVVSGGNETNAEKWLRKAASAGHVEAQYQLGLMYLEYDNVEADTWLQLASKNGHPHAEEVLQQLIDGAFPDYR